MQIIIDGKNFELNVESAQKAGFLKPMRETITDFHFGDVFGENGEKVIIAQIEYHHHNKKAFCLLGLGGLKCYLNTSGPYTKGGVLDFLNKSNYNYLGNINESVLDIVSGMKG